MATTYQVSDGAIMSMTLVGRVFAQECMIVRHYRLTLSGGGVDTDGPTALSEFAAEQWDGAPGLLSADILPAVSSNFTQLRLELQWIYPTRYAKYVHTPVDEEGTGPASCEPPGVAVAITLRAVTTGRHSRGVVHMPAVPVSYNANGLIAGVAHAIYDTAGAAMRRVLTSVDTVKTYQPIIYYRELPALSQDVAERSVSDNIRTMRRRVVGRGT